MSVPAWWLIDASLRLLLSVGALVAAGVWAFNYYGAVTPPETTTADMTNAIYAGDEEFTELLENCDRENLTQWLKQTDDSADAPVADQRQGLTNRIHAASVVAKSRMRSRKFYGISTELRLRQALALLDLENNQFDESKVTELTEISHLYEGVKFAENDSRTERLRERASVGKIVSNFIDSLETRTGDLLLGETELALEKLRQLDQRSVISRESRENFARLSQLSRKRLMHLGKSGECCDRLDELLNSVSQSNLDRVFEEFAKLDCENICSPNLEYLSEPSSKDRFLLEFETKLNRVMQSDQISEEQFSVIADKFCGLIQAGWSRSSSGLIANSISFMKENGEFPTLEKKFDQLLNQTKWIGKPINFQDFKTIERSPATLKKYSNLTATIVVYLAGSDEGHTRSSTRLIQMIRVYNSLANREQVRLCGVVVHDSDEENAVKSAKALTEKLNGIEFWYVDSNSSGGQAMAVGVPFEELPYVVVLDKDNKVVTVDPRPTQAVEFVSLLKKQDR